LAGRAVARGWLCWFNPSTAHQPLRSSNMVFASRSAVRAIEKSHDPRAGDCLMSRVPRLEGAGSTSTPASPIGPAAQNSTVRVWTQKRRLHLRCVQQRKPRAIGAEPRHSRKEPLTFLTTVLTTVGVIRSSRLPSTPWLPEQLIHTRHGDTLHLLDHIDVGSRNRVHSPVKGRDLDIVNQSYNMLLTALRAIGERANAELKGRWRCLRRIRLCPTRIGTIVAAAIVLSTLQRGTH
jgi:hypothetical protein